MKVLVVGATGLLGRAVVSRLTAAGHEVVAMSRTRAADLDGAVWCNGDVRLTELGLPHTVADELQASVTHIISAFGSVAWNAGPATALDLHERGTQNLLQFAARCARLERVVHVSSLLVLGRAKGSLGNRELDVGQGFRNWYEYGKFLAECRIREESMVPTRIVRFGPVLGAAETLPGAARHGLLAAVPTLLRGWPMPVARCGAFPSYVADAQSASEVITRALEGAGASTWTYFDPTRPTLAQVLTGVCSAWGVVPRLVDIGALRPIAVVAARRLGYPDALLSYTQPWFDVDPRVLDALPFPAPAAPPGYIEETGLALRAASRELV